MRVGLYICNDILAIMRPLRYYTVLLLVKVVMVSSCGSLRGLSSGEYSVEKVGVTCDNRAIDVSELSGYARQTPAHKTFGLFRGKSSKTVIYDSLLTEQSARDISSAVRNMGYLQASTAIHTKRKGKKIQIEYAVHSGEPYYIGSFAAEIGDSAIADLLSERPELLVSLSASRPFSVVELNSVRNNITSYLNDKGYYRFNKDYIDFTVDTLWHSTSVGLTMTIRPFRSGSYEVDTLHTTYKISNITYSNPEGGHIPIREKVLRNNTFITSGSDYSASAVRKTYNRFAHLGAVRYTNISFSQVADTALLDCNIAISTNKPSSLSLQPEGTNTAGDLGAALIVGYTNNNIGHGSETFSVNGRVAYEAIRGLEGYSNQDYQEYSLEASLSLPRFVWPFRRERRGDVLSQTSRSTEVTMSYNLQNRPEFHRRLFSAAWRYRWSNSATGHSYHLDLLEVNYIYMPWISDTFREDYLDNNESRNAILRYNYEDLFVMKLGFGMSVTKRDYYFRANIETSGNLLHAIATLGHVHKNSDNQYTFFRIAYAQYVKGDVEYTRYIYFGDNNQLVLHGAVGIAYPYGNSRILPFDKRYFSGGANSVRGWSVRSLGPGRFHGKDGRIDFINQTGDVRLDLNVEYRARLFWKVHGAAFIDAGNIWTLRNYAEQEGGQFRLTSFYKELAASYGVGVRLLFGYFTLRFDLGMKAINPDYTTQKSHFPVYHPRLSRDLAFHFAVGMPF